MSMRSMNAEEARSILDLVESHDGNVSKASRATGLARETLRSQIARAQQILGHTAPEPRNADPEVPYGLDPIPPKTVPIEEVVAQRKAAFAQRNAHAKALRWRKLQVPINGPYALMFFGDPHLDDDGCDLTLFEKHAVLARDTKGIFAANIGDTTNNWAGRLARLWAEQNASAETARALVKYYLGDFGIPWFMWLCGNHDLFDGPVGREVFERHKPHYVQMEDWQAKVTLCSPNGHEFRVWAAHNFKGNSIWNNLHGLERAAQIADHADLYVAGHHHDSGTREGENPHRGNVYHLMRVRGYKFIDHYADLHQFGTYQYGAAGMAVVDPCAERPNAVKCFLDPHEGAEFLTWKRRNIS